MDEPDRHQRAREVAARARAFASEHVGRFGLVLLADTVVSVVLKLSVLVAGVGTARRVWTGRRGGRREVTGLVVDRRLVRAVAAAASYGALRTVLLAFWLRDDVSVGQRAGGDQVDDAHHRGGDRHEDVPLT